MRDFYRKEFGGDLDPPARIIHLLFGRVDSPGSTIGAEERSWIEARARMGMDARRRLLFSTIVRTKVDDEVDMLISVRAASVITSVIKTGTSVTFSVVLFRILGKKNPPSISG